MIEPCDICGDIGFPECIATCIKCKVTREHCYCMRIYSTQIPDDWICDSCQSKNGTTSHCKVDLDPGWQVPKRNRPAATGKVKFIPEEEVIKLSSGNFPVKPIPPKSTLLMNRKASVKSKSVISKMAFLALNSNPRPIVREQLPRNGGVAKNAVTDQHASRSICKGPVKQHIWENQQLLGRQVPDREVHALDLQKEKPTEGAPCEAMSVKKYLPSVGSGVIICSVADCNNIEKDDIQSIQENLSLYRKFLPTSTAAWSGCFATSGNYYGGFEAHPPCTVNIKAYKFSRRMPPVLQLESLPSLDIFTDVFQDDCPTLQDIAMYFFPSDHAEKSRNDLNSIFESMVAEKSMLRSSIDGVELLVFTSNQLNMHSRGTIETLHVGCFLWGIFRQSKTDKATATLPDMEDVDMDVDMIGGENVVGRTDHVLNDKSRSVSQKPLVGLGTHLQGSTENVEKKTPTTPSNSCVQRRPPLVIDLMKTTNKFSLYSSSRNSVEKHSNPPDKLDVPPGFEAHGKNLSCKFADHVKKPVVNGGRSVSNGACFVGLSGRGRVQPLKSNGH